MMRGDLPSHGVESVPSPIVLEVKGSIGVRPSSR
jgi:hypothetical protein